MLDRLCCIRDIGEATINRVLEPALKSLLSLTSLLSFIRDSEGAIATVGISCCLIGDCHVTSFLAMT